MSEKTLSDLLGSALLTNTQAAKYCGYSLAAWNKARGEGHIGHKHISPPEYIRINQTCVMYEKTVLDEWLKMFIKAKFAGVKNIEVAA
jgi:hypothetical protein